VTSMGQLPTIEGLTTYSSICMASTTKLNISERVERAKSLGIIMGGGAGSRLFPLTQKRSKPAVPLAGKYRLVDIPISNCINSGVRHVYVLTQYNSASLNRHINNAYKFDSFSSGFVEVLAAQQTPDDDHWYQGTADAVRQNMRYFLGLPYDYFIILSGDQLYQMDFRRILASHIETEADLTIATIPVEREPAKEFGIMATDAQGRITEFVEKPQEESVLDDLRMGPEVLKKFKVDLDPDEERFQASMGIYVFNRQALIDALDNDMVDFGKHIIPDTIEKKRVFSYVFQGYWEDIGTIGAFFEANLDLCATIPEYDFFDADNQIYTNARFLPASKVNGATIKRAILSDGCIISDATIDNAVIGLRSIIEGGSSVKDSIIMGADFYPHEDPRKDDAKVPLGIGRDCRIERAIIDKNARIGDGCVISPDGKPDHMDGGNFYIRDGIVVIPKSAVLEPGTWI